MMDGPDPSLLTPEQREIQSDLHVAWARVSATEGLDRDALEECARAAMWAIFEDWPDARWAENAFFMGGNSAVMHWNQFHDVEALRASLLGIRDAIRRNGWHYGGPSGMLEAREVGAIYQAAAELEKADPRLRG
jgi:hypothetical protein